MSRGFAVGFWWSFYLLCVDISANDLKLDPLGDTTILLRLLAMLINVCSFVCIKCNLTEKNCSLFPFWPIK